jgi:hypothetical protein
MPFDADSMTMEPLGLKQGRLVARPVSFQLLPVVISHSVKRGLERKRGSRSRDNQL